MWGTVLLGIYVLQNRKAKQENIKGQCQDQICCSSFIIHAQAKFLNLTENFLFPLEKVYRVPTRKGILHYILVHIHTLAKTFF